DFSCLIFLDSGCLARWFLLHLRGRVVFKSVLPFSSDQKLAESNGGMASMPDWQLRGKSERPEKEGTVTASEALQAPGRPVFALSNSPSVARVPDAGHRPRVSG